MGWGATDEIRWNGSLAEGFKVMPLTDFQACLYLFPKTKDFMTPVAGASENYILHYGRPGGVLPRLIED